MAAQYQVLTNTACACGRQGSKEGDIMAKNLSASLVATQQRLGLRVSRTAIELPSSTAFNLALSRELHAHAAREEEQQARATSCPLSLLLSPADFVYAGV